MHLNKQFILPEWFFVNLSRIPRNGRQPSTVRKTPLIREISTSAYAAFAIEYWTIIPCFFFAIAHSIAMKLKLAEM